MPAEIGSLRQRGNRQENIRLLDGVEAKQAEVNGRSLELAIETQQSDAATYGVKVCRSPNGEEETLIYIDTRTNKLVVDTRKSGPEGTPKAIEAAPFVLEANEALAMRVFVDRSVVEVFVNRRQAIARRIYPSRADSTGVSLFSHGGTTDVRNFRAWEMSPSNAF